MDIASLISTRDCVSLVLVTLSPAELARREGIREMLKQRDPTMDFTLATPDKAHEMQGWLRAALKDTMARLG